jgi:hypothetical protein
MPRLPTHCGWTNVRQKRPRHGDPLRGHSYNLTLKAFAEQLVKDDKKLNLIQTADMRIVLDILNTMLQNKLLEPGLWVPERLLKMNTAARAVDAAPSK